MEVRGEIRLGEGTEWRGRGEEMGGDEMGAEGKGRGTGKEMR